MTPDQARVLKSEFAAASKQAAALTTGMSPVALTTRPATGGWSVAENLQHLILSADAMVPLVEVAVVELEGADRKARGASGLGIVGWLLVKSLEPPARLKTKTSQPFEPIPVADPLALPPLLDAAHAKLEVLLTRATGLATGTVKIVSPFNARATYNVYAAFRITVVHARRHLWQAEQVNVSA